MEQQNNKKAIFLDNNGNVQTAIINYVPNKILHIRVFNENQNQTGYIDLYFHHNNRIFLDVIYCYDEFRGNGVARKMNDIVDYILRDYEGYIIRGVYEPSQLSTDRENKIVRDQDELNIRAKSFYESCGYSIINFQDFLTNSSNYPNINIRDDFQLGEEIAENIVVKIIKPKENYNFNEIDGVLINDNILNSTNDKEENIQKQ